MNRPVTSREYKLMLNVDRFADREEGNNALWELIQYLTERCDGKVKETQATEAARTVWYIDTPGRDLDRRGFSLRIRNEEQKHKLTLKLRAADRYLAATQEVSAADGAEEKFEEDILPPFTSKFSHSISVEQKAAPAWVTVADVVATFPGLAGLGLSGRTPVETVNDFSALELMRKVGKLEFEGETVKVAFNFWYLQEQTGRYPFVAELSYDYDLNTPPEDGALEEFPEPLVTGANRLFESLQRQSGWLDLRGTTKTAAAYLGM